MPRVTTALYIVIESRSRWWVDFEGRAHGPYATREDAVIEAGDLARFSAHSGRRSQVHVPDDEGRYRIAWQSAEDDLTLLPPRPEVVQLARKLAPNRMGGFRQSSANRQASPQSQATASRVDTAGPSA